MEVGLFFVPKTKDKKRFVAVNKQTLQRQKRESAGDKRHMEVEVVRVKITLACTECKQRNYNMTKEKKTHPERMETKKYCKFCKAHTLHKETK